MDINKNNNPIDLSWVDEFIENVRPYIYVRLEDNLLIKRPNNAQKLNDTGAFILKSLIDGTPISRLLDDMGRNGKKTEDIANFMLAVKQSLEGCLDEFTENPAVEVVPFDMHFSQYPVLSEVALTYQCNLKCVFCYAGCGCTANPVKSSLEMTEEEIKGVLWKLYHEAKVPSVSFTGGEPAIVSSLPDLVQYAKELGLRVNLITNGTMINGDLAGVLADSGLDSAQVSIEGITAGTHDTITGVNGAFKKSVAGVRHLKGAGILTHTNTTITKTNLHECVAFPGFVKEMFNSDRFSMNLVIPTGSGAVNDDIAVAYMEVGEHIKAVITESKKQGVEFMWYSPVPMCMFNSILHGLGNKGCSACDGLISVGPNGDVLPCASYDDSVGNLLENDFQSVWQSDRAKNYRKKLLAHPHCRTCDDFHICNGGCPLYWRHMGFGELTHAKAQRRTGKGILSAGIG